MRRLEQWQDKLARLFPKKQDSNIGGKGVLTQTVTFQVTDACNLACTYCYQINKGTHHMSFETAKKFIDDLLDEKYAEYISVETSPGIIIDFIGGEPLLEIDLIDQICDYFVKELIRREHPWATRYCFSMCSNGVLYFDERVQKYLKKHKNHISFSISIDGNKELHDSCRIFPDGRGSYDIAMKGVNHYRDVLGGIIGSKMTLCPENIEHTYEAVVSLLENGYEEIFLNCVYEEGWTYKHATILYEQLKKLGQYIIDNDLFNKIYLSIFEENFFRPKSEKENENWCWGADTPILTTKGYKPIQDIQIGDLVYTEDGTVHPVVNTTSHYADNVVNISMSGAFDLVCTDNHKLYAMPFDYRGNKGLKHYKEYGKYEVKELGAKDQIRLFDFSNNQKIPYDENLAYLIGRYIGDGWDWKNGCGICGSYEEEQEIAKCFKKAKVSYAIDTNRTVKQFRVLHRDKDVNNDEFIRVVSQCGHLAHGKRIPEECFNWNEKALKSLIFGYLSADGYKNARGQYRCNTVSYELAQDLMLILRTIGYAPTCYFNKRAGKTKIEGREVTIKDRYEIYFYEDPGKARYVHKDGNKWWTSHLKVTPAESQQVYNITVDTNHSYIAGGIVSSNCGGNGVMISVDYKGDIYPCIRYMESSLGPDIKPLIIGNVERGVMKTCEETDCVNCLRAITRRSQSTDECWNCPIAEGCSWCTAYNYQVFGTVDKRATFICPMHKARALANAWFWNTGYRKAGENKRMKLNVPEEWALEIISKEEYDMLKQLEGR